MAFGGEGDYVIKRNTEVCGETEVRPASLTLSHHYVGVDGLSQEISLELKDLTGDSCIRMLTAGLLVVPGKFQEWGCLHRLSA